MLDPPFPSWPVKSDAVDRYAMLAMPFWLRAKSTKRPAEDPVDATLAAGLLPPSHPYLMIRGPISISSK